VARSRDVTALFSEQSPIAINFLAYFVLPGFISYVIKHFYRIIPERLFINNHSYGYKVRVTFSLRYLLEKLQILSRVAKEVVCTFPVLVDLKQGLLFSFTLENAIMKIREHQKD
jgi:hypothetical protein